MYVSERDAGSPVTIFERILMLFPRRLAREIRAVGASRLGFPLGLCEIRLRTEGTSSLLFFGESVPLLSIVGEAEIAACLDRMTEGSLYAYRAMIAEGYVPLGGGVRCGISGVAGYDGERIVGIREIGSLVFRFPFARSPFSKQLYRAYLSMRGGMLIYSPPGGGKTTALRSLVGEIAKNERRRVAVIDERYEFSRALLPRGEVDILSGYPRSYGIELAVRTLTPEVIVIDEISPSDAEAIRRVSASGVPIIATAHARTEAELLSKPGVGAMVLDGAIDVLVGLSPGGAKISRREVTV